MAFRPKLIPMLLLLLLAGGASRLPGEETNIVRFAVSAPYSSDDEIGRRFGFRPPLPEYSITQEQFRLYVPRDYSTNDAWGVLVWLSTTDEAYLAPDWADQLARRHVVVVSPFNCGPDRHPIDRLRLALDATSNVCRRFRIDRKRIYIGGFSEGARLASMLGIGCADIFTGTLCVCGANFYLHVPAGGGLYYPSSFSPNAEVLHLAREAGKYVLVTGDGDSSHDVLKLIAGNGFRRDGFKKVFFLDVPGLQHAMPGIGPLDQALDFLDEKRSTLPAGKPRPASPAAVQRKLESH